MRDHAIRQRTPDRLEFGGDALRHSAAVFADQQHRSAQHDFFPVQRRRTGTQIPAFPDFGDVGHPHRNAVPRSDHDFLDLIDVADLSRRANEILLAVALDVAGAHVRIIGRQRRHDVAEAKLVGHELCGIGQHMKLLLETADGVDLAEARHSPQLRPDDPVLNRAQVALGVWLPARLARLGLGFDREHVDFAESGGHRSHRGLDTGGQLIPDLLDPFVDQLSGKIDIGTVLEDDRDLAEAIARLRARAFEVRQPAHRGLDRERDALLDFQRRVAGRTAVDLDLNVRDVGNGVDGQEREIPGAEAGHREHTDHHQPPLTDGEGQDAVNHCPPLPSPFPPSR